MLLLVAVEGNKSQGGPSENKLVLVLMLVLVLVLVAEMLLCQGRFLLATLLFVVSDRV